MFGLFDDLSGDLVVFYTIGIIAAIILVIQLILTAFGGDFDDFDVDGDGVSFRSIIAFLAGFGWAAAAARQAGASLVVSILVGIGTGIALFLLVALIWKAVGKLEASGNVDYTNAVGSTGTVYLPIAANREAAGKVEVMVQGRISVVDAYTAAGEPIESHSRVRITEMIDQSTVLVEPL